MKQIKDFLLSMADLLGSQLKENELEGLKFRKEFLSEVINNY